MRHCSQPTTMNYCFTACCLHFVNSSIFAFFGHKKIIKTKRKRKRKYKNETKTKTKIHAKTKKKRKRKYNSVNETKTKTKIESKTKLTLITGRGGVKNGGGVKLEGGGVGQKGGGALRPPLRGDQRPWPSGRIEET